MSSYFKVNFGKLANALRRVKSFLCDLHFINSAFACLATSAVSTLCDRMDCSPPGSSVHGMLQARVLEWVAMSFSRGSSQPRDQTCVSCLLHWQAGSLPLTPCGKPTAYVRLPRMSVFNPQDVMSRGELPRVRDKEMNFLINKTSSW